MFKKLKSLLTKKDKQFLYFLVAFSIIISIIETIGISAIMPFLSVATDFKLIHSNEYAQTVYTFFNFSSDVNFVIAFGIGLLFFYFFRGAINLLYVYMLARFTQGRYHLLAYRLFENYLGMSYKSFVNKNTSTLTKSIINEASNLTGLISSLLMMMSEIFVMIFIYAMMLYVNYKITLILSVFLVLNALLMTKTISKKIRIIGNKRADIQKKFYEIINRSFGNFKLIKLNLNDKIIIKEFGESSHQFAQIGTLNATLKSIPRLFLEVIGFCIVIGIVIYLVWKYNADVTSQLGVVSMFVLSLYRLLPSVNRIMSAYNAIQFSYKALEIVHNDLMYPIEDLGDDKILYNNKITVENLSFEYNENKPVLQNISLEINKADKIAFIGESGSGKSTLVDIIIGLYKPQSGKICVDDIQLDDNNIKAWRKHIGYIPQSVYLFDGTVADNIVFDREYDEEKIINSLKKANIYNFLQTKDGLDTFVGEGGIMLSGGQKQRIAIARALYGDPDVLVLDEATSALDNETEEKIMDEIYNVSDDKTLIIIAHRLSTIDRCNKVYTLDKGKFID